jgi:anti-sigma regulatory factor (Ser/Thr protein kinase)
MSPGGFRHEAVLYAGERQFVEETAPFVAEGVAAGDPVLVVVATEKIARLRGALGSAADRVVFADMAEVGSNPSRIIPAWRSFVEANPGRPQLRGVGEPIGADRRADELLECQQHESLLNIAFSHTDPLWLRCPYDVTALERSVIDEARRSHPFVTFSGTSQRSALISSDAHWASLAERRLSDPTGPAQTLPFDGPTLSEVRRVVLDRARAARLDHDRADRLALAAHEAASNSVRHGGGSGTVRIWQDEAEIVCEVKDGGSITEPLVGRVQPHPNQDGGRGLWIINQLCDLSHVRSSPAGTTVRMRMRLPGAARPS